MNIDKIETENYSVEKYFYNQSILSLDNNKRITRLHLYRIKMFLYELLSNINQRLLNDQNLLSETIFLSLQLLKFKQKFKATLNEITIAALWTIARQKGLQELKLSKLVKISKNILNKKVQYKNIFKVLSFVRRLKGMLNPRSEILKVVSNTIIKLMKDEKIKRKLDKSDNKVKQKFFYLLRKEILEILSKIDPIFFSGKSRDTSAAIIIYIASKKIADRVGMKPIISAKNLEKILGVCQFTILRKYKQFLLMIKNV